MEDLQSTAGVIALVACVLAVAALAFAAVLSARLRRVAAAQAVVLGGHEQRDLVAHAERLEGGFTSLQEWVEEVLQRVDDRLDRAERRLDGAIAYSAVVRYDAYGEMSGRQSSSIALLDAGRTGLVVSSILHRDQARIYAKQVRDGHSELELSPEEAEAVETALAGGRVSRAT